MWNPYAEACERGTRTGEAAALAETKPFSAAAGPAPYAPCAGRARRGGQAR